MRCRVRILNPKPKVLQNQNPLVWQFDIGCRKLLTWPYRKQVHVKYRHTRSIVQSYLHSVYISYVGSINDFVFKLGVDIPKVRGENYEV